jgi:hypothetical protein
MGRVWTYVTGRELSAEELKKLEDLGSSFVRSWTAHDVKLSAEFKIFEKRILIITVNEDIHAASGCSIDKLTRFIKETEKEFDVQLLNRMLVAMKDERGVKVLDAALVKDLLAQHELSENSVVYNTSASSKKELQEWEKPLKETWLKKYLQ